MLNHGEMNALFEGVGDDEFLEINMGDGLKFEGTNANMSDTGFLVLSTGDDLIHINPAYIQSFRILFKETMS